MAKSQADALFERLRANGLRKRVAKELSEALSSAQGSRASKAATTRIAELQKVVADLEDRAKGGPAKRQAAAKKAAATRKRAAAKRSAAAKKAAKTRAKGNGTSTRSRSRSRAKTSA
jgi:predicted  nucleic acid-binding Zn-ribbon protein